MSGHGEFRKGTQNDRRRFHTPHQAPDPAVFTSRQGIRAVKRSLLGLLTTALIQGAVVSFSGSVALLADTVHNLGDAATAVPLWIAFSSVRWKPSRRFPYGYGRLEDLAGVAIVLAILSSAVLSGYQSLERLFHPQPIGYLWAVMAASVVGFLGNEAVAVYRLRVGREIGSAALVADGYHARADGLTSLGVLLGVLGVSMGYPVADPVVGLLISGAIFRIVWKSGRAVGMRLLDGIDPEVADEIRHALTHIPEFREVTEVRVRWLGHRLQAEINAAVRPDISVEEGHRIAQEAQRQLLHHLRYLSRATIHIDPSTASGEEHHRVNTHTPDGKGEPPEAPL